VTRFAFVLFAITLGTHYGYEPLTVLTGLGTPGRWFYLLRGIEGMMLFIVLMSLIPRFYLDARSVCAWGAVEEAQTAAGRLIWGLSRPAPPDRSLFDAITGLPVYTLSLLAVLWVLVLSTKDR
jgi:hypothetical protein